ncbi:MAG: O6-methylguanine-DNA methyltransferase [Candidatus Parcubacteria bacterium]|jgi:O-6-methylguanine DNA methyltransferase
MTENKKSTTYYYTCPKPLGYLEITLDSYNKVQTAVFVENKNQSKSLPENITNALDAYFNNKKDIPIHLISKEIVGTDFQKSIWQVIRAVSFGTTITYTDMAIRAGRPRATRAAGTACGKNPVALFIPCHRVVRKQGEDYGYSWGPERKKWLLKFEKESKLK